MPFNFGNMLGQGAQMLGGFGNAMGQPGMGQQSNALGRGMQNVAQGVQQYGVPLARTAQNVVQNVQRQGLPGVSQYAPAAGGFLGNAIGNKFGNPALGGAIGSNVGGALHNIINGQSVGSTMANMAGNLAPQVGSALGNAFGGQMGGNIGGGLGSAMQNIIGAFQNQRQPAPYYHGGTVHQMPNEQYRMHPMMGHPAHFDHGGLLSLGDMLHHHYAMGGQNDGYSY